MTLFMKKLGSLSHKDSLFIFYFSYFVYVFSLFCYYLPLEINATHHLNKLESPSPTDASYQVSLKLKFCVWRRRSFKFGEENVKSLQRQRRRTTDIFWSEKLIWAFGSGELKIFWTDDHCNYAETILQTWWLWIALR